MKRCPNTPPPPPLPFAAGEAERTHAPFFSDGAFVELLAVVVVVVVVFVAMEFAVVGAAVLEEETVGLLLPVPPGEESGGGDGVLDGGAPAQRSCGPDQFEPTFVM